MKNSAWISDLDRWLDILLEIIDVQKHREGLIESLKLMSDAYFRWEKLDGKMPFKEAYKKAVKESVSLYERQYDHKITSIHSIQSESSDDKSHKESDTS